ncbi:hypothetical protein, partial [uncultured Alistipes sp.]|uniref:hypothetical protein n=1 Tax=uncultured Alistipes sp. TaxID=538949 RepID=UPI002593FBCA
RPKSGKQHQSQTAISTFCDPAASGNPRDRERCPGLRFRKISRYFPLWNQICDFWFGGPGKNRYL